MEIIKRQSPNFREGRENFKPKAIVIHVSDGSFSSSLDWCMRKESKVSYHFLVKEDGQIYELVDPKNTAWHAGLAVLPTWSGHTVGRNPNLETIGIAFAGFASKGPTYAQILAIRELLVELSHIHIIPLDREHVIGHNEIRTDKVCPGAHADLAAIVYFAQLQ